MTLGLFLYGLLTALIGPFRGIILRRRLASGKDTVESINERQVRTLSDRSDRKLIWWHGASVGECTLLLETAKQFAKRQPDVQYLFTCQTLTAHVLIRAALETDPILKNCLSLQSMAPLDFKSTAQRFIDHWRPNIYVGVEGEIWPHTLGFLNRSGVPSILINARMTEKSLIGWSRWPATTRKVFGNFSKIIAGDKKTGSGLSELLGKKIETIGNLKSALPPPPLDLESYESLSERLATRRIFVAASTHPGEEAIVLDALMHAEDRPFLILVPRHPDRAHDIEKLLDLSNLSYSVRSDGSLPRASEDIYLADTIGEMGLWLKIADEVYLGGGHCPGVGGHNPIEPLQYDKPIITGPSLFNFEDLAEELVQHEGFTIADDAMAIRDALPLSPPSKGLLSAITRGKNDPMVRTLDVLESIFKKTSDEK